MKMWAEQNGRGYPCFCYINVASVRTSSNNKDGKKGSISKKMAVALKIDENSKLRDIKNQLKKRVMVLVLDELDMLFEKGCLGKKMFAHLITWANRNDLCFSMIGISNCVNDEDAKWIREEGRVSARILFVLLRCPAAGSHSFNFCSTV